MLLTDFQSFLLQTISVPFFLISGIYNLSPNKFFKKYLPPIFFTLCAGSICGTSIHALIFLFSLVIVALYLYKKQSKKYIFLIIPLAYIIGTIIDNLLCVFLCYLFHCTADELQHSLLQMSFSIIMEFLLTYTSTFLVGKLIRKIFFKQATKLPNHVYMIVILNLFLCCTIILSNVMVGEKIGYTSDIALFHCVLFLLYFVLSTLMMFIVMKSYQKQLLSAQRMEQFENLQNYTKNLEQVYNNLRSFKHDYINIMASMSAYFEEKQYDALEEYFNEHILPTKTLLNQNTAALNGLMNVYNLEIKSLLSVKLMSAIEASITTTLDIPYIITDIHMNPVDLTRIMGIYLDNAIEAALETNSPILNVHMAPVHDCIVILISNNFVDKGLGIAQMNQAHVTTKGENHGIGLTNVAEILSGYEHVFHETFIDGDLFCQHLQIQNT